MLPTVPSVARTVAPSAPRARSCAGPAPVERGQATPLAAMALLLAGLLVLALVAHGGRIIDDARARTAADAAALAGAADGEAAARRLAEANGGRLVAYVRVGDTVLVTVVVGDGSARARASRDGTWCGGVAGGVPYSGGPCPLNPG